MQEISTKELQLLKEKGTDFILLDVREPSEYEICNIGGKLVPLNTLQSRLNELDKNKPIVVHCKLGGRSRQACEILEANGFKNVSNLSGGIIAWIDTIDQKMKKY